MLRGFTFLVVLMLYLVLSVRFVIKYAILVPSVNYLFTPHEKEIKHTLY